MLEANLFLGFIGLVGMLGVSRLLGTFQGREPSFSASGGMQVSDANVMMDHSR